MSVFLCGCVWGCLFVLSVRARAGACLCVYKDTGIQYVLMLKAVCHELGAKCVTCPNICRNVHCHKQTNLVS